MKTGIKIQRSAVLKLNNVRFPAPNPQVSPEPAPQQEQIILRESFIDVLDNSTVYLKGITHFGVYAQEWIRAKNNSNIVFLEGGLNLAAQNNIDANFSVFVLENNSNLDFSNPVLEFFNDSNFTYNQIFSNTVIDTTSHLKINNFEENVLNDLTNIKGSVNNVFYNAGEPYINITHSNTAEPPTNEALDNIVIGTETKSLGSDNYNSIVIGKKATVYSSQSIALGYNSFAGNELDPSSSIYSTVLGSFCQTESSQSTVLGVSSKIGKNAPNSIALGRVIYLGHDGNTTTNNGQLSIGLGNVIKINSDNSIGIGNNIDILTGVNNVGIGNNITTSGSSAIAIGEECRGSGIALGNQCNSSGGGVAVGNQSSSGDGVSIGNKATMGVGCYSSISIGEEAKISSTGGGNYNCIAIGTSANVDTGGTGSSDSICIGTRANAARANNCIAIGTDAIIDWNQSTLNPTENAVQISAGTNSTDNSIQFLETTIANEEGIQVKTGDGPPTSNATDGTLYIDTSGLKLYFRAGGQWIAAN